MRAKLAITIAVAGALLVLATVPVWAHHAFAAEFDATNVIALTGTVTKLEWMNPHVHFFIDVKGDGGKVIHWDFEMGSPNALLRAGWTRNSPESRDCTWSWIITAPIKSRM